MLEKQSGRHEINGTSSRQVDVLVSPMMRSGKKTRTSNQPLAGVIPAILSLSPCLGIIAGNAMHASHPNS